MNWWQLFPLHSSKGYTLDLLFASNVTCTYNSADENLVLGDQEQHDSAFFKTKGNSSAESWHNSKNLPVKNFYKANFENINVLQDLDWDLLLGDLDIGSSLNKFYSRVNTVIDNNVFNISSNPSTYPEWYTSKLIKFMSDKKDLHAKWKDQIEIRVQNEQLYSNYLEIFYRLECNKVRTKCIGLSRQLYARYIEDVENRIRHHVISFWSFVNKSKKSSSLPNTMFVRDRSANCRRIICNLFSSQFKSVFRSDSLYPLALNKRSSLFIFMQIEFDELVAPLN